MRQLHCPKGEIAECLLSLNLIRWNVLTVHSHNSIRLKLLRSHYWRHWLPPQNRWLED